METIIRVNQAVNAFVWGPFMLVLIGGVGAYLTLRMGFFQITGVKDWLTHTLGSLGGRNRPRKSGVSPFQALSAALASTIGVGNIAGVATAIVLGGPGAVFWMWVSAFFGMMTKFSEVALAVRFRRRGPDGNWIGGPMYYMEYGLGWKWLAVLFAGCCALASFGMGNMSQSNTVAHALRVGFGVPNWISGAGTGLLVGLVILGGVGRITRVTSVLVPFMGLGYLLLCVVGLLAHAEQIGPAFRLIVDSAFDFRAAAGGGVGYAMRTAMRYGVARGVFSNEAGLGSAPIIHAAADTDSPVKQGMWGIFEVFADTLVVCTLTAIVILTSGLWTPEHGLQGAQLSMAAFEWMFPGLGARFIVISVLFFAVSSIIGWAYYGEQALHYLFGPRWTRKYRVLYSAVTLLGATAELELVWNICDTFNGLMSLPNLIAVLAMSGLVIKMLKEYLYEPKQRLPAGHRRRDLGL